MGRAISDLAGSSQQTEVEFQPSNAVAIPVTSRRDVRVYVADHQGTNYVHVREFKHDWRTGKMGPSHSGATVPVERLGELIEALQQLQAREGEARGVGYGGGHC